MKKQWQWKPITLITAGVVLVVVSCLVSGAPRGAGLAGVITGALLAQCSVMLLWRDLSADELVEQTRQTELDALAKELAERRNEIEHWRDELRQELDDQGARLDARERQLVERFATHQELFEFPVPETPTTNSDVDEELEHSAEDRRVVELLEEEAARIYEKVREGGYETDGQVDLDAIRLDTLRIVTRIAAVYNPGSSNPLLETSVEQLLRAAGRICLHTLVLLERLPLGVERYNLNRLYSYVKTAVRGYGAYQAASPWLTYLSRGLYAGRFAAGGNPLTLGAWWASSEVGRRGAKALVGKLVDQQAVALLHDVIRVIATEVANVYGGDFRHRHPAWILGSELTEMLQRFPLSRESLREAMRIVSALPLPSEYDRIYLYRCLAEHRAAGHRPPDPTILSRQQREELAGKLEDFFRDFVHGTTDDQVSDWRNDFEEHFDLRLSLEDRDESPRDTAALPSAVTSLFAFLTTVAGVPSDTAIESLDDSDLFHELDESAQASLCEQLAQQPPASFEPPDLEPADQVTTRWLNDLVRLTTRNVNGSPNIEQLLVETGAYFRRTPAELRTLIDQSYVARVTATVSADAPSVTITPTLARAAVDLLSDDESLAFAYRDLTTRRGDQEQKQTTWWLIGVRAKNAETRLLLIDTSSNNTVWDGRNPVSLKRIRGFLIDDCCVLGGQWHAPDFPGDTDIVVAGALRSSFEKWFAPLLRQAPLVADD